MFKTIPALAAALLATAVIVPTVSQAATAESVRVSYADLNLGSGAGQEALQRRIAGAAESLCNYGERVDLTRMRAAGACREATIADAQAAYDAAVASFRRGTVTVLDAAALIVTAQ